MDREFILFTKSTYRLSFVFVKLWCQSCMSNAYFSGSTVIGFQRHCKFMPTPIKKKKILWQVLWAILTISKYDQSQFLCPTSYSNICPINTNLYTLSTYSQYIYSSTMQMNAMNTRQLSKQHVHEPASACSSGNTAEKEPTAGLCSLSPRRTGVHTAAHRADVRVWEDRFRPWAWGFVLHCKKATRGAGRNFKNKM